MDSDKPDVRVWNGVEYEHDYMLDMIKKIPALLKEAALAREELENALGVAEEAYGSYEDASSQAEQVIAEWRDLKPFWDEIKAQGIRVPSEPLPDPADIVKEQGFWS